MSSVSLCVCVFVRALRGDNWLELSAPRLVLVNCTFLPNGGSRLEPGGGHRPLQIVARLPNLASPQIAARPPNLVVLLTHCGQLILRKKSRKFDSTRCQLLRLKCTIFDFRWGCTPDPTGGAYSAARDPLAVFKGPTSKGRSQTPKYFGLESHLQKPYVYTGICHIYSRTT